MSNFSDLNILVIKSTFYEDVSDALEAGAVAELQKADADFDVVSVPGTLEIPILLSMALDSDLLSYESVEGCYHGCVVLGCVIRGETSHYDIVSQESARSIMDLAISSQIPLGNGILTVENKDQAMVRADKAEGDKGGAAVRACLSLVQYKNRFEDWS
ncbi:MAG: 6,7-dimethyl-8-ribityllumazine synthase [Pseudomonadota bacterium]